MENSNNQNIIAKVSYINSGKKAIPELTNEEIDKTISYLEEVIANQIKILGTDYYCFYRKALLSQLQIERNKRQNTVLLDVEF